MAERELTEHQFVVFQLDGESYGLEIERVQEIDRMERITVLPQAPASIEGCINLRGNVTPVLNLRERLGLPRAAETAQSRIVVVTTRRMVVGLVVDAVSQVLRIQTDAIEPPPALTSQDRLGYLRGVAKLEGLLVILLDLDRLLEDLIVETA